MEEKTNYFYPAVFCIVWAVSYLTRLTNESMLLSMLLGLLVCIAIAIIKWIVFMPFRNAEKAQTKSIQFYEKCVANGIQNFDSEKNCKRAELIAKDLGYKDNINTKIIFEKGKALSLQKKTELEQQINSKHIAKLSEQEKEEYAQLTKYASCVGNEKTICILSEEISALRSRHSTLSRFSEIASSSLLEREKDWATAGGIASGIAGGAAGVAVALDVQAENAEIRARNTQKKEMINSAQMYLDRSGTVAGISLDISIKERTLQQEKLKLVADIPAEKIIQYLNIDNVSIDVSETGSIRVAANVLMKEPLMIYEDLSARIDGTLVCVISQNGRTVGTAELVLPLYGVHPSQEGYKEIKGICLHAATPNVPCTYSFSGQKLYAIEN